MRNPDEIMTELDKMEEELLVEIEKLINEYSLKTLNMAKELCPVDKGRLRASLNINKKEQYMHEVGTNVHYAEHVEFGTPTQGAQPYLVPALILNIKDLRTATRKKLNKLIKEFVQ